MKFLALKENTVDFKIKICLREHVQRLGTNLVFMKRICMHGGGCALPQLKWLLLLFTCRRVSKLNNDPGSRSEFMFCKWNCIILVD